MSPDNFMKNGCAAYSQLTPCKHLSKLFKTKCNLKILSKDGCGITCMERTSDSSAIQELHGPVLDNTCTNFCSLYERSLKKGLIPKYALANELWLGVIS